MAHYQVEFVAKALARKTRIDLVVPSLNLHQSLKNSDEKFYQKRDTKFPLVICLHGFGEDINAFQNNAPMIKLAEENGIALCCVNGENKWYLNMGPIDDFYSLIERDLLDFVYGNFSNLSEEAPLAIMGVSMGGYGALYHYLKNTNKYDACVALSPATKPDFIDESKYGSLRDLFLQTKGNKLNIFLSVGENDFIADASRDLDNFLKDNKIDASYKYIPNADHSWTTWGNQSREIFDYLNSVLKK